MAKSNGRRLYGLHSAASHFEHPDGIVDRSERSPSQSMLCNWDDGALCPVPRWGGTPVCWTHAMVIALRLQDISPEYGPELPPRPLPKFQPYVYYLMLSPTTVKIGTTTDLKARIRSLRTEVQYVVGIEYGSFELERERHRQFADERRIKGREDFQLSDRLKQHIDMLLPQRDALVAVATTYPLQPA